LISILIYIHHICHHMCCLHGPLHRGPVYRGPVYHGPSSSPSAAAQPQAKVRRIRSNLLHTHTSVLTFASGAVPPPGPPPPSAAAQPQAAGYPGGPPPTGLPPGVCVYASVVCVRVPVVSVCLCVSLGLLDKSAVANVCDTQGWCLLSCASAQAWCSNQFAIRHKPSDR
jgi:hypothetical protein